MGRGRGGSGRGIRSGRGRGIHAGRVHHANFRKEKAKSGLSKALGKYFFTYGENNSVDKIRTIWEKFVQHIGIDLGQDISTELRTRTQMVIQDPTHSQEILDIHMHKVQLRNKTHIRLRETRNKVLELLAADAAINNLYAVSKTADTPN